MSAIPGYNAGSYSAAKTVAYIIAPFAIVGATYLIGGHHQVEIYPNAGFFWPRSADGTHLRDEGVYGLKADAYVNNNIQIEGSFGYINHFESRFAPTVLDQAFGIGAHTVHGLMYDVNGVFNFDRAPLLGPRVSPFVTFGIGGLSTLVPDGTAAVIGGQFYTTNTSGAVVLDPGRKIVVADNSAFFAINYGGGIKTTKLWGPMGVRADIRGRTFPNFRGLAMTWLEASGGVTLTFGER